MLVDSSFIKYFSKEVVFAKVNAEKFDSSVAKEYKVSGYPTFVLTDSKGEEIDRIVGYLPTSDFLLTVENYQKGIGTLADLLGKAADSVDRNMYMEIADKYKYSGRPDEAKEWFDKIIAAGEPTDSLTGEARFALADMLRRSKDYSQAIDSYRAIKKDFSGKFYFSEYAQIYTAICYRNESDTANALKEFELFLKEFPNSEDTTYAAEQIMKLKGESTEN